MARCGCCAATSTASDAARSDGNAAVGISISMEHMVCVCCRGGAGEGTADEGSNAAEGIEHESRVDAMGCVHANKTGDFVYHDKGGSSVTAGQSVESFEHLAI